VVSAAQRREAARYLVSRYGVSERRACCAVKVSRSVFRYQSRRAPDDALRRHIRDLAETRLRYGYKRIYILLRRQGLPINHKRVHRLYCLEGLQLRAKRPRRHVSAAARTGNRQRPTAPNQAWSMDFMAAFTGSGGKFRVLTILDMFTRESLAIEIGRRLRGEDVVRALNRIVLRRTAPKSIYCDNGSEFTGRLLDLWAYHQGVEICFSRPGKPTDNALIESFNGRFRDECLNTHWFTTLEEAQCESERWRQDYNENRPHMGLNGMTPNEYAVSYEQEDREFA